MPRPKNQVPQYLLHKSSGNARCRINGRDHYLGPYGTEESRKAYSELLRQHFSGSLTADPAKSAAPAADALSIAELVLAYVRHAEGFYRKVGKETSEVDLIKSAVRPLVKLFGATPAIEFGPVSLKAVRAAMVEAGWVRSSCNQGVNRIRRVFRFAAENELLPEDVLRRLRTLTPLMRGKCDAPDRPRRSAVPQERIDAVLSQIPESVADMVRAQLLIGCRPGELLAITPAMIDRSAEVWVIRLEGHKTAHHGHERRLYVGPAAQKILAPYLSGRSDRPVFNITRAAYCRAVTRGCERAFDMPAHLRNPLTYHRRQQRRDRSIPDLTADQLSELRRQAGEWRRKHAWSPHWLRHSAAAKIKDQFGIEAVAATLGHSKTDMSELYSGRAHDRAVEVAKKIG